MSVTCLLRGQCHIRPQQILTITSCQQQQLLHIPLPPSCTYSSSTVLCHVFCLPLFRFPSRAQVNATLKRLPLFCRQMCPIIFHLLLLTSLLIRLHFACFWSSMLIHDLSNSLSLSSEDNRIENVYHLSSPLFIFEVWQPYIRTNATGA